MNPTPEVTAAEPRQPIILWLVAGLALLGLLDATYLTAQHYLNAIPTCLVGSGCETVLTSRFATIGPVPISLVGVGYYLALFLLAFRLTAAPDRRFEQGLLALSTLGFIASLGLLYIQATILRAFCTYCLISAGTSTAIFGLTLWRAANTRRV